MFDNPNKELMNLDSTKWRVEKTMNTKTEEVTDNRKKPNRVHIVVT